jgi:hypothetical protein
MITGSASTGEEGLLHDSRYSTMELHLVAYSRHSRQAVGDVCVRSNSLICELIAWQHSELF